MNVDLFAGISVSDLDSAVAWYERLLGSGPSFRPNDVEAVWEVADHGYLYVEQRPDRAGHGMVTLFVSDLERRLTGAADRGVSPAADETYDNGVRKVTFRDHDGNEVAFGGGPA